MPGTYDWGFGNNVTRMSPTPQQQPQQGLGQQPSMSNWAGGGQPSFSYGAGGAGGQTQFGGSGGMARASPMQPPEGYRGQPSWLNQPPRQQQAYRPMGIPGPMGGLGGPAFPGGQQGGPPQQGQQFFQGLGWATPGRATPTYRF